MKNILLFSLFLLISFLNLSYTQTLDFNLKNLDNVSVEVRDDQGLLSETIYQKIITEVKLKLISSGMKVTAPDEAVSHLYIIVHAIKSNLAEHRILVLLNIYENVTANRVVATKTDAITYSDYSFFTSKNIEQAIYDKVMDVIIINFLENYLNQQ